MSDQKIMVTVLLGITLMLIIVVVVIWFFVNGQKKIHKIRLQQKEQELIFQKELLLNTVKTQETERDRIAAELHDDITSQLSIIHLNMHLLKKLINSHSEMVTIFDQIDSSLSASIERSRSISHELMPQMIKKFGIQHALKEIENAINATGVIQLDIDVFFEIKILDNFKLLHIFRIIQELLNNALKYSKAQKVQILFKVVEENIHLIYQDDGIGFDAKTVSNGLGISNIRTRCQLLNGTVDFGAYTAGEGVIINIKFPNHD